MRLTLLRAPGAPDVHADLGRHRFTYALAPGADTREALAQAHALNLPLRPARGAGDARPLIAVDSPDVVVESVKLADDRSGDVVVRLYEARGGRADARLSTGFPLAGAALTDLLERPSEPAPDRFSAGSAAPPLTFHCSTKAQLGCGSRGSASPVHPGGR